MFSFILAQFVALAVATAPVPVLTPTPCVPVFTGPKNAPMPDWKWRIADMIGEVWEDRPDGEIAKAVAYSEHGLNCVGVSDTNDHGLFQLHGIPEEECRLNAEIAHGIYLRRGFQPWTDYRNGNYKRYLSCS